MSPDDSFNRIIEEGQCIGCGLCASMFPGKLSITKTEAGYLRPVITEPLQQEEVRSIYRLCPGVVVSGLPPAPDRTSGLHDREWGPWLDIRNVHAGDPQIRHEGATGGSLTALACFLLDSGRASKVLHIRTGGKHPALGETLASTTSAEARRGRGSCYASAAPLTEFVQHLDAGKPFAVIAKPCDISAIRLYGKQDSRVEKLVTHCLTMVCGGIMPPAGFDAFLARVGIDPDRVTGVSYRGYGCPGPVRITLDSGETCEFTYTDFWGTDESMWTLPWRCKICPDGTGEAADLASLDTWPGGTPTEWMMANDPGTNACIARTPAGKQLLDQAIAAGYLVSESTASLQDLSDWQPHQVSKKHLCEARFTGLRKAGHLGIETVNLATAELDSELDPADRMREIDGTVRRITIGKHRDDYG